jgi:uncharacterized protein YcbX
MSKSTPAAVLTGLFIYPVKSLRGIAVASAEVDELGLVGDRRFLVVDEHGRFLTQRTRPAMARMVTALSTDQLLLSMEGAGSIAVPRQADPTARRLSVSVWSSEDLRAEDCGDEVGRWLEERLQIRCRLVRIGPEFARPILKPSARPGDRVTFADAYPFLIASEASLENLNDRLIERGEEPVPMDRFRPNFVVRGSGAFSEDTWTQFTLGSVTFRAGGNCGRCPVTTTDQFTGERGVEPLRTLAEYRRRTGDSNLVDFGQNLIHTTKNGRVNVGDEIKLD